MRRKIQILLGVVYTLGSSWFLYFTLTEFGFDYLSTACGLGIVGGILITWEAY